MKLYLDMCALKRPFDDISQPRVEEEAIAVLQILDRVASGEDSIAWSSALTLENSADPDEETREAVQDIAKLAVSSAGWSESLRPRLYQVLRASVMPLDALHFVMAEAQHCDHLITCDDRFIARSRSIPATISVLTPLEYLRQALHE